MQTLQSMRRSEKEKNAPCRRMEKNALEKNGEECSLQGAVFFFSLLRTYCRVCTQASEALPLVGIGLYQLIELVMETTNIHKADYIIHTRNEYTTK